MSAFAMGEKGGLLCTSKIQNVFTSNLFSIAGEASVLKKKTVYPRKDEAGGACFLEMSRYMTISLQDQVCGVAL